MKRPPLYQINHIHDGIQEIYFFENDYGASVIKHYFSHGGLAGLWELAVLTGNIDDYELCYTTPITSDVIGYLTDKQVSEILSDISNLPQFKK